MYGYQVRRNWMSCGCHKIEASFVVIVFESTEVDPWESKWYPSSVTHWRYSSSTEDLLQWP